MGFDALLGNDRLKQNLTRSLSKGHVSHFYLISGPEGSGKHTLAKLLAAAILCQGEDKPCGRCTPCRKVMDGSHPDFITVDDPEKKTVTVDLIRQARADVYIQPNESEYKIYLFPRAQDMGLPGQNALLKILEEPPKYGVFLLLTDNPDKLLPTVRSRCTELNMQALPEDVLRSHLRQGVSSGAGGRHYRRHRPQRRLSGSSHVAAEWRRRAAPADTGFCSGVFRPGRAGTDADPDAHGKVEAGRAGGRSGKLAGAAGKRPCQPKRHPGGVAPVPETRPEPQQPGAAERRAVPAKSGGLHDGQRLPRRRVRLAGMGAAIGWK